MNNEQFNEAYNSLFKKEVKKGVFIEVFTHEDEMRLKSLKEEVLRMEQKKERINKARESGLESEYKLTGTSDLKSKFK